MLASEDEAHDAHPSELSAKVRSAAALSLSLQTVVASPEAEITLAPELFSEATPTSQYTPTGSSEDPEVLQECATVSTNPNFSSPPVSTSLYFSIPPVDYDYSPEALFIAPGGQDFLAYDQESLSYPFPLYHNSEMDTAGDPRVMGSPLQPLDNATNTPSAVHEPSTYEQALQDLVNFDPSTIPSLPIPAPPRNLQEAQFRVGEALQKANHSHQERKVQSVRDDYDYSMACYNLVDTAVDVISLKIGLRFLVEMFKAYDNNPTSREVRDKLLSVTRATGIMLRSNISVSRRYIRDIMGRIQDREYRSTFWNNVTSAVYLSFSAMKKKLMVLDSIRRNNPGIVDNINATYENVLGVSCKDVYISFAPIFPGGDAYMGDYDYVWSNPAPDQIPNVAVKQGPSNKTPNGTGHYINPPSANSTYDNAQATPQNTPQRTAQWTAQNVNEDLPGSDQPSPFPTGDGLFSSEEDESHEVETEPY